MLTADDQATAPDPAAAYQPYTPPAAPTAPKAPTPAVPASPAPPLPGVVPVTPTTRTAPASPASPASPVAPPSNTPVTPLTPVSPTTITEPTVTAPTIPSTASTAPPPVAPVPSTPTTITEPYDPPPPAISPPPFAVATNAPRLNQTTAPTAPSTPSAPATPATGQNVRGTAGLSSYQDPEGGLLDAGAGGQVFLADGRVADPDHLPPGVVLSDEAKARLRNGMAVQLSDTGGATYLNTKAVNPDTLTSVGGVGGAGGVTSFDSRLPDTMTAAQAAGYVPQATPSAADVAAAAANAAPWQRVNATPPGVAPVAGAGSGDGTALGDVASRPGVPSVLRGAPSLATDTNSGVPPTIAFGAPSPAGSSSAPGIGPVSTAASTAASTSSPTPSVATTPTDPNNPLTAQTISRAPGTDRFSTALDEWNNIQRSTDPQYQADLRSAMQQGAAAGGVGSGTLRTHLGDLANTRQLQLDTQKNTYLDQALNDSIGDAFKDVGIAQQQQQFQNGQQSTAFNEGVTLTQLDDQLTNSSFGRALQQELVGSQGNPADIELALSQIFGSQASAAGAALAKEVNAAAQNGGASSGNSGLTQALVDWAKRQGGDSTNGGQAPPNASVPITTPDDPYYDNPDSPYNT